MIGKSLSHYEIVDRIGAGGMGEVYRARDSKLGRQVALKLLPEAFARDRERLARFQREAQVLAALNHPNIAAIYGLEEAGGERFLVMELAEGESLEARLKAGAIPLDEALTIARQIAIALEEAHDRGIVHRDLKPGNVHVTSDGRVKVLDFGLAKAFDDTIGSSPDLTRSPTITGALTGANVILGTAAYMSPEQARGKPADRRADIWSFGVVLFEMISGKRLFEGETISETLASILKDEVPWDRLPAGTPPALRELLRRSLERDPKRRLQAIGEARITLDAVLAGDSPALISLPVVSAPRRGPRRLLPWAVAALGVVVAVAAILARSRPDVVEAPLRKFWVDADLDQAADRRPFTVSPDGRRLAYVAGRSIWVRDFDALEPRLLAELGPSPATETSVSPFWSWDSRSIAYAADGKIWKIPAEGGSPAAVCNSPAGFAGGSWTEDDRIIFSVPRGDMFEVSARGGDPEVILARHTPEDVDFHDPWVLPEGKGIVYALHRQEYVDTIELLAGGKRRVLLRVEGKESGSPQVVNMVCYNDGHLVFRRDQGNRGVWAVPFSLASLEVTGEPFLVAAYGRDPSVASNGILVFRPGVEDLPARLVWVNASGEVEATIGEPLRGLSEPSLSPDGNRIAYVANENGVGEIWVQDLTRDTRTRLTFTPEAELNPVWIPGQDMVAFACARDSGMCIAAKAADGSGEMRVLAEDAVYPTFTPDGRSLIYQSYGEGSGGSLMRVSLEGGGKPELVEAGNISNLYDPRMSADGRYLTYLSWERGTATTYIRPFPRGEGKWELAGSWESSVRWRPGRIFYTSDRPDPGIYVVPASTQPVLSLGTSRKLFDMDPQRLLRAGFDVTPDGQRFLLIQSTGAAARSGIVVVENWLQGFEKAARP